jgi:hypothetical protein
MTTNQVIAELQKIVQLNPERGEQECFIYSMIAEEPDSTISDRVDINGTEPQEA